MSQVVVSEKGMFVHRVLILVELDDRLDVKVCWRGLSESENTIEHIHQLYQNISQLLTKLLRHKRKPSAFAKQARNELNLP